MQAKALRLLFVLSWVVFTGCGLFIDEPIERDPELSRLPEFACVNQVGENLERGLDDATGWAQAYACLGRALLVYDKYLIPESSSDDVTSRSSIESLTNRLLSKSQRLTSPEWTAVFELKSQLLGGDTQVIRLSELKQAADLLLDLSATIEQTRSEMTQDPASAFEKITHAIDVHGRVLQKTDLSLQDMPQIFAAFAPRWLSKSNQVLFSAAHRSSWTKVLGWFGSDQSRPISELTQMANGLKWVNRPETRASSSSKVDRFRKVAEKNIADASWLDGLNELISQWLKANAETITSTEREEIESALHVFRQLIGSSSNISVGRMISWWVSIPQSQRELLSQIFLDGNIPKSWSVIRSLEPTVRSFLRVSQIGTWSIQDIFAKVHAQSSLAARINRLCGFSCSSHSRLVDETLSLFSDAEAVNLESAFHLFWNWSHTSSGEKLLTAWMQGSDVSVDMSQAVQEWIQLWSDSIDSTNPAQSQKSYTSRIQRLLAEWEGILASLPGEPAREFHKGLQQAQWVMEVLIPKNQAQWSRNQWREFLLFSLPLKLEVERVLRSCSSASSTLQDQLNCYGEILPHARSFVDRFPNLQLSGVDLERASSLFSEIWDQQKMTVELWVSLFQYYDPVHRFPDHSIRSVQLSSLIATAYDISQNLSTVLKEMDRFQGDLPRLLAHTEPAEQFLQSSLRLFQIFFRHRPVTSVSSVQFLLDQSFLWLERRGESAPLPRQALVPFIKPAIEHLLALNLPARRPLPVPDLLGRDEFLGFEQWLSSFIQENTRWSRAYAHLLAGRELTGNESFDRSQWEEQLGSSDYWKKQLRKRSIIDSLGISLRFHSQQGSKIYAGDLFYKNFFSHLASGLVRGYAVDPIRQGAASGITENEIILFITQSYEMIRSLQWGNPDQTAPDLAKQRFFEANAFTLEANGDALMDHGEIQEWLVFLFGTRPILDLLLVDLKLHCPETSEVVNGQTQRIYPESCVEDHWAKRDGLWSHLSRNFVDFAKDYASMDTAEKESLIKLLINSSKDKKSKPGQVRSNELETMVTLLSFGESIFNRYDTYIDGWLTIEEALRFFPVICPKLVEVSNGTFGRSCIVGRQTSNESLYGWLLHYKEPPIPPQGTWETIKFGARWGAWEVRWGTLRTFRRKQFIVNRRGLSQILSSMSKL